ncbi:ABC transporter permease, partial [Candidatus Woesearchaeota archaeon]|nr:ABC transporter permease [Candidatus Woesearchaeota archaeon]
VSEDSQAIGSFAENVSNFASVIDYGNVSECVSAMSAQDVHICIEIDAINSSGKGFSQLPSANVIYYYDNTRKQLSLAVINNIQKFFGLKAEEISIGSARSIIEEIQSLVGFIAEHQEDIGQIKNESAIIRKDLVERKARLEAIREDFLPAYTKIKEAQAELHSSYSSLENSTNMLDNLIAEIKKDISALRHNITEYEYAIEELPEDLVLNSTTALVFALDNFEAELDGLILVLNSTKSDINQSVSAVDSTVKIADDIKFMLDEEIRMTDVYIQKIDASIARIDEVSAELDNRLALLEELHPELAEKLVKPIVSSYVLLLKGASNIQISFPQLLVIIIMFISLLFANIATINEINDRAYFRNLIAPVDSIIYFAGLFITSIVIVFFQILVLFLVAETRFGIDIGGIFWQISSISVMLISFFILVGMFFAYLFRSVQSSILMTTFSALLFFLFGNTIAPLESMPPLARLVSSYNPLVLGEYLIKQVQLFGNGLSSLVPQITLLVAFIGVMLILVIMMFKASTMRRV